MKFKVKNERWKGELESNHTRTCLDKYAFHLVCRGAIEKFDIDVQFRWITLVEEW